MSKHLNREQIAQRAELHTKAEDAVRAPHQVDRTFELPKGLYAATVGCYLGFLAIMGVGFASPGLIVPMGIFVVFVIAGFTVPAMWTQLAPESRSEALRWSQFRREGISTLTGRLRPKDAAVQVLILPVLIVMWGLTVVTIAALVR